MIPIGKMFKVKILAYLSIVKANLNMRRGIVSGRVVLLPWSTEIQPYVSPIRPSPPHSTTPPRTFPPPFPRPWPWGSNHFGTHLVCPPDPSMNLLVGIRAPLSPRPQCHVSKTWPRHGNLEAWPKHVTWCRTIQDASFYLP